MQRARYKASIVKWGLTTVILLFAILITIIILIPQGVGLNVSAPLAIFGLATVWLMGWRRCSRLYQSFYADELSRIQGKPTKETIAFLSQLSSQEIEILNYIAQGYLNKQIANKLGISEQTIKNHVTSILRKLNANARTEAVVIAIKQGLISIS